MTVMNLTLIELFLVYCDKRPRRPKYLVRASVVSTVPSTAVILIDFPGNGALEDAGISEYIGYVGCYDLDNNGYLETK
jgi:hypothetical protein